MTEVSQAFAKEFRRVLSVHGLDATAAARLLGVSRQAFHSYLNGKSIPRQRIQAKAAELWSLSVVTVREVQFDTFQGTATAPPAAVQMTLNLTATSESIKEEDLHFDVKREGDTLRVALRIEIPA